VEKLEPLRDQIVAENLKPGEIATRPREAGDEPSSDQIRASANHYDWDGIRFHLEESREAGTPRDHHVEVESHQFSGGWPSLIFCFGESSLDDKVLAFDPAQGLHLYPQGTRRYSLR
jgi:hypothetical protein